MPAYYRARPEAVRRPVYQPEVIRQQNRGWVMKTAGVAAVGTTAVLLAPKAAEAFADVGHGAGEGLGGLFERTLGGLGRGVESAAGGVGKGAMNLIIPAAFGLAAIVILMQFGGKK